MEVWSSSPSPLQQQQKAASGIEQSGPNSKGWAPLEQYERGEVQAATLTSPVFTGVSLHYRSVVSVGRVTEERAN